MKLAPHGSASFRLPLATATSIDALQRHLIEHDFRPRPPSAPSEAARLECWLHPYGHGVVVIYRTGTILMQGDVQGRGHARTVLTAFTLEQEVQR